MATCSIFEDDLHWCVWSQDSSRYSERLQVTCITIEINTNSYDL